MEKIVFPSSDKKKEKPGFYAENVSFELKRSNQEFTKSFNREDKKGRAMISLANKILLHYCPLCGLFMIKM